MERMCQVENVLSVFKVIALGAAVINMTVRVFTVKRDSETQKMSRDINALMFLIIFLVLCQF